MSPEAFEFLTAVDDYKRQHMRSFLTIEEIFEVLGKLGYRRAEKGSVGALSAAIEAYKEKHGRLFPNWSEIFQIARELGWDR